MKKEGFSLRTDEERGNDLSPKMSFEDRLLPKYIKIALAVSFYWTISILTVFVNKALLSSKWINLDAPLFVTWFQCVISTLICFTLSKLAMIFPTAISFPRGNPYTKENIKKVLPLSIIFTFMIASNNLCLQHVGVAFYYIGRSLTTVFNVLLTYLILGQKTSLECITCCAIIVGGFWLGVDQEHTAGSLSISGTIYGVLGSLSCSLYATYTKRVLPLVNQEIWLLSYYNNAYSIFLFLPLMLFNDEYSILYAYDNQNSIFWLAMTVGGVCGFAVGYATALQIQVTSPLTHNISGTAKACAQTVLASYWFDESKQILWWASNFIVLGASAAYARLKQLDIERSYKQGKPLQEKA
ncbi:GDP-fucose transporter 1 [Fopius arisanus]|uniref:GDP-fucose transporter 1 n=1 Tax=Fopius arisanus TaxID=64838 RepID=A0A0C9RP07_9HYME|nr:PREDICTED: GDP-fucose transporter 1 [Fopius arisanus]